MCELTAVIFQEYMGIGTLTKPLGIVTIFLQSLVKFLKGKIKILDSFVIQFSCIKRLIYLERG